MTKAQIKNILGKIKEGTPYIVTLDGDKMFYHGTEGNFIIWDDANELVHAYRFSIYANQAINPTGKRFQFYDHVVSAYDQVFFINDKLDTDKMKQDAQALGADMELFKKLLRIEE